MTIILLKCPEVEERKRNAPTDKRATSKLTVADVTFSGQPDRRTPPKIMKVLPGRKCQV